MRSGRAQVIFPVRTRGSPAGAAIGPSVTKHARRMTMAEIIAFPATRVHAAETPPSARRRETGAARDAVHATMADRAAGDPAPSLRVLTERMRRESQDLVRQLDDLRAAVCALGEADLPGQARALVGALDADARPNRDADAAGR
jgi:hypothetical protein